VPVELGRLYQAHQGGRTLAGAPGFVPLVSVVELGWVLASAYQLDRNQMVKLPTV
jgi:hypothetical protein